MRFCRSSCYSATSESVSIHKFVGSVVFPPTATAPDIRNPELGALAFAKGTGMIPTARDAGELIRERTGAGQPVALISLLSDIQDRYHYLPHNLLVLLSETLDIPLSQIYSVATFYNAFSLKPRGAHIVRVCMGTACHVRGAPAILNRLETKLKMRAGETSRDRQVTLETVNCLGACALGPVTVVDGAYSGQMDIAKVDRLLKNLSRAAATQGETS